MRKISGLGKFLGGGLGWILGGPIGGLLGFMFGSMVDDNAYPGSEYDAENRTTQGNFGVSLMVLLASVMKADGKVVKSELDYVKQFLVNQFGHEGARQALVILRGFLRQDIPLKEVCSQIKGNMDYPSRLQLLHLLFNISLSDGYLHATETVIIEKIHEYLGITSSDYTSVRNMFIPETDSSYKILEVDGSVSDEELKKAYRRMAVKYHPDKVSHLGEQYRKSAEEKFKKVTEAYEKIKKSRNIL